MVILSDGCPPFDRGNSSSDPEKCQGLKLIYWRVKWNLVDVGCSNPKPLFWCERFQKLEHWEIMVGEHHSFSHPGSTSQHLHLKIPCEEPPGDCVEPMPMIQSYTLG